MTNCGCQQEEHSTAKPIKKSKTPNFLAAKVNGILRQNLLEQGSESGWRCLVVLGCDMVIRLLLTIKLRFSSWMVDGTPNPKPARPCATVVYARRMNRDKQ
eukprot:scaffold11051_cov165-Amphora_coffeaeformis.AAC.14